MHAPICAGVMDAFLIKIYISYLQVKGYRYLEEDNSDESDSENSEKEEEDGEDHKAEEMEREDGVGGQDASNSQGDASPAAMRRGAEIHHHRQDNVEVREGEKEERAGG